MIPDYVPAPTLSYKGRHNHKIAQRELLARAGILDEADDDELQKRDAARLKAQQQDSIPVKEKKKKKKKKINSEPDSSPTSPLVTNAPQKTERYKNRKRDNLNLELKRALGAARRQKK